jgi:GT2 family glycosyltransferase
MPSARPERVKRAMGSIKAAHFGRLRAVVVSEHPEMPALGAEMGFSVVPYTGDYIMARGMNLGLATVTTRYAFLFEDDCFLRTPFGIDELARISEDTRDRALIHASLQGDCLGHEVYRTGAPWEMAEIQPKDAMLNALLVPMSIYQTVGPLDEAFVGYGYDDTDYGLRTLDAGFKLAIYQRVVVDHESFLSGFRTRKNLGEMAFFNKCLLVAKHGRRVMRWIRP